MMTTLRVQVDDRVLAQLQARSDRNRRDLEQQASRDLASAAVILPDAGRVVAVSGDTLDRLETLLGGGSILNQADLLQKIERLAGISFLHCRLPFTPNQLEALQEKAARNGFTVQELVDRTAPRIYEQFFDLVART